MFGELPRLGVGDSKTLTLGAFLVGEKGIVGVDTNEASRRGPRLKGEDGGV